MVPLPLNIPIPTPAPDRFSVFYLEGYPLPPAPLARRDRHLGGLVPPFCYSGGPFWHLGSTLGSHFGTSGTPWRTREQQDGHDVFRNSMTESLKTLIILGGRLAPSVHPFAFPSSPLERASAAQRSEAAPQARPEEYFGGIICSSFVAGYHTLREAPASLSGCRRVGQGRCPLCKISLGHLAPTFRLAGSSYPHPSQPTSQQYCLLAHNNLSRTGIRKSIRYGPSSI